MMRPELKLIMMNDMLKLPFVMWDRFFEDGLDLEVFGWIDREDNVHSYKDFVSLRYDYDSQLSRQLRKKSWMLEWSTSSAKYSKEIGVLLNNDDSHNDCQRVEDFFSIGNMVRF